MDEAKNKQTCHARESATDVRAAIFQHVVYDLKMTASFQNKMLLAKVEVPVCSASPECKGGASCTHLYPSLYYLACHTNRFKAP